MGEPEKEITLEEQIRQLQKDLLSERILRIGFQMQLLGILRDEAQTQLKMIDAIDHPSPIPD